MKKTSDHTAQAHTAILQTAGAIFIIALLVAAFFSFWKNVERNELERAEKTLVDMSASNVKAINYIVAANINNLEGVANGVEKHGYAKSPEVINFLDNIVRLQSYERLTVVFPDGMSYSSDGQEKDISAYGNLDKIARGEIFTQNVQECLFDGLPAVNIYVPIRDENGSPIAALVLNVPTEDFSKALDAIFFSEGMFYYIIDKNGNYVATNTTYAEILGVNFFDTARMLEYANEYSFEYVTRIFKNQSSGDVDYSYAGSLRYGYLRPVGINDWMLLAVVPKELISGFKDKTVSYAGLLLIEIFAVISAVFLFFYITLQRRRKKAELDERCFRVLSERMNKVIFDWNFVTGEISCTSNFETIFGRTIATKNVENSAIPLEIIHPDDAGGFARICNEAQRCESFGDVRFRVKDGAGDFRWCTFSMIGIRDDNGKPYKAIGFLDDIDERVRGENALTHKAERDQLTGLYNKTTTEQIAADILSISNENEMHAMISADIDNFKDINDSFGHLYGDEVLQDIADEIKTLFRSTDVLGRFGGDEFVMFVRDIPKVEFITEKANELIRRFQNKKIKKLLSTSAERGIADEIEFEISMSLGISIYPRDGTTYEQLYGKADEALYEAKHAGKNTFRLR